MNSAAGRPSRRLMLAAASGVAVAGSAGLARPATARLPGRANLSGPTFRSDPFALGVASGDPQPDGVVLWTRLAPDPLAEDGSGGMPRRQVPVHWQVALDERFHQVVRSGVQHAGPKLAHSVHAEVSGLEPGREYFYRFRVGREVSPVGRTRTAPRADAGLQRLRFAFGSCQNRANGFYPAYRDMLEQDLDVVLFLGDYIYEGWAQGDLGRGHLPARDIKALPDYRVRYAQYRTDPDLQAIHAAVPWVVTLDDHDVDNNWAGDLDGHDKTAGFLQRRAAAFQAFYEHVPMRPSSMPSGPDMDLYRRIGYGDLVEFFVVDTRQFRSNQPQCEFEERIDGYCPGALDPDTTILGDEQRRWLHRGLVRSRARWNVLAQQTRFTPFDVLEGQGRQWSRRQDPWGDGYVVDRTDVVEAFGQNQVSNPVVLGGDAHRNWVFDFKQDFDDVHSETLATEFVATSISSGGDPGSPGTRFGGTADNPHEVFTNRQRGYVRCEVTPELWQADFRVAESVRDPDAAVGTLASFVVEDGRPGAQRA